MVQLCFIKKNDQRRYKHLVLGMDKSYLVSNHSNSLKKFSETDIIKMLELLIDNIFVMLDGCVFQQTDGNHMNTYRAPFLVDLFLYTGACEEKRKGASPIL